MTVQKRKASDLPYDLMRELVSYDAKSGVFTRLKSGGRKAAGTEGGYLNDRKYRLIWLNGKWFLAHRLAWYYVTGEWPTTEIDHIDGDPSNNRFDNLRLCDRSQNEANSVRHNNRSGFRGVCFLRGKWQAGVRKNGKRIHLGSFATAEEASAAYERAAKEIHGQFAFIERPQPPKQEALSL